MDDENILCPFDKEPCIGKLCAVWSVEGSCSFASLPDLVRVLKNRGTVQIPKARTDTESSGSGKYRTLLFD